MPIIAYFCLIPCCLFIARKRFFCLKIKCLFLSLLRKCRNGGRLYGQRRRLRVIKTEINLSYHWSDSYAVAKRPEIKAPETMVITTAPLFPGNRGLIILADLIAD